MDATAAVVAMRHRLETLANVANRRIRGFARETFIRCFGLVTIHCPGYAKPPRGRKVDLNRPMLSDVRRLDETLRSRWIALHFFFSFELSYQREPRSPIGTGFPTSALRSHKNLLQTPHSLCRMVGCPLEIPRLATTADRAEIGRIVQ